MRIKATGRPIRRERSRTFRQLSSARSISEIANSRGFARYSCCISTNTTIGTPDEFASVRRLITEVTRLPFPGQDGPGTATSRFPKRQPGHNRGRKNARTGPVMVVDRSKFCQAYQAEGAVYASGAGKGRSSGRTPSGGPRQADGLGRGQGFSGSRALRKLQIRG